MRFLKRHWGRMALAAALLIAAVALVAPWRAAEAVIGGQGNVSLSNNPHNLALGSTGIQSSTETRICVFCHTPHNAITDSSLLNAPLWNHKLSTASYTLKAAGFYNQGAPPLIVNLLSTVPQPDGASKLCLSCHDGTVSVGAVMSESSDITFQTNSCLDVNGKLLNTGGCAGLGTNLTSKHVVSVAVNDTLVSDSAAACATQNSKVVYPWTVLANATVVVLRPTMATYGGSPGVDGSVPPAGPYKTGYNYGVQCSSCHDPHYWISTADKQVAGYKFLVTGFDNLCNACHSPCP